MQEQNKTRQSTYCSLFVAFSDLERVFKDGVHDPTDAERRLDYIGDDFLHYGWQTHIKRAL